MDSREKQPIRKKKNNTSSPKRKKVRSSEKMKSSKGTDKSKERRRKTNQSNSQKSQKKTPLKKEFNKPKKKKKKKLAIYIVYVLGFILFSYPFLSNWYYSRIQNNVSEEYHQSMSKKNDQELSQMKQEMLEHNKKLADTNAQQVSIPMLENNSNSFTKIEKETLGPVLAVIEIPKIRVDLPIYKGTSDFQLKNGAGLLEGTSLPFGGEDSHSVITGHRGLPSARLFTDLPKLKLKDQFYLKIVDEIHAYEVDQIKVVEPQDVDDLKIVKGQDYVTLLTCTPYMLNTHRLLVRGHRIPYSKDYHEEQTTIAKQNYWKEVALYAIIFLVILWFVMFRNYLKKRKEVKKNVA